MLRALLRVEANMAHKLHHPDHTHTPPTSDLPTRRDFLSALICTAVLTPWVMGQQEAQSPSEMAERFQKMSEDYEKAPSFNAFHEKAGLCQVVFVLSCGAYSQRIL